MCEVKPSALRSTNAREGITTSRLKQSTTSCKRCNFEKHQCPRGYYDLFLGGTHPIAP